MKRIVGSIAILLIPGALMAQGRGSTHTMVPRPNVPVTSNGPLATNRHDMNPPAVTVGDQQRSERAEARAKDVDARVGAREHRIDVIARTPHKRKHHHKRRAPKP